MPLIFSTQKGDWLCFRYLGEPRGFQRLHFPGLDALCHPGVGCGQTGLAAARSSVLQER